MTEDNPESVEQGTDTANEAPEESFPGAAEVDDSSPLKKISGISLAPVPGEAKAEPKSQPKPSPASRSGVLRQLGADGNIVGGPEEDPAPARPLMEQGELEATAKPEAQPDEPEKEVQAEKKADAASPPPKYPSRPSTIDPSAAEDNKAVIEPTASKSGLSVKRPNKKNWQKEAKPEAKAEPSGGQSQPKAGAKRQPEPESKATPQGPAWHEPAPGRPATVSGLSVKRPNKKNWQKETATDQDTTPDEKKEPVETTPPKKKSKKTLIIIGIAALLVIVIGTGAAAAIGSIMIKKAKQQEARSTDLLAAVDAKDTETIDFVAGICPERMNELIEVTDADKPGSRQCTPLGLASQRGLTNLGKFLISKGADPNLLDSQDTAPVHYAAKHGHRDTVAMLLEAGANIDAKGQKGCRPLHFAVATGQAGMIGFLLEKGARVNCRDKGQATPLHVAAISGGMKAMEALLDADANVRAQDDEGRVPLHYAQSAKAVAILIKSGTNPNISDAGGRTALHYAAATGDMDVIDTLLRNGADINAKSKDGRTPLDVAHKSMVISLRNRGAKSGK